MFRGDEQYGLLSDGIVDVLEQIETPLAIRARSRKGAPPERISKLCAASDTKWLIENFSARPPTLTKDGPFLRGARLLFEVGTGERCDLTRYCRSVLAHPRPKNL
jgi:hypothetical protein